MHCCCPQVPSPCALLAGGKEAKAGGAKKQQQSGKAEQIRLKNLVRSNGCEGLIVHACMHACMLLTMRHVTECTHDTISLP
jgi:hypothetical protein